MTTITKSPRANFSALVAQRDALAWAAADWRHLANRCADQPELVAAAEKRAAEAQARANVLSSDLREIALAGASGRLSGRRAA